MWITGWYLAHGWLERWHILPERERELYPEHWKIRLVGEVLHGISLTYELLSPRAGPGERGGEDQVTKTAAAEGRRCPSNHIELSDRMRSWSTLHFTYSAWTHLTMYSKLVKISIFWDSATFLLASCRPDSTAHQIRPLILNTDRTHPLKTKHWPEAWCMRGAESGQIVGQHADVNGHGDSSGGSSVLQCSHYRQVIILGMNDS